LNGIFSGCPAVLNTYFGTPQGRDQLQDIFILGWTAGINGQWAMGTLRLRSGGNRQI